MVMAPTALSPNGVALGYRTKVRTREVVCDWPDLAPEEGCAPLTATIAVNLSFDEIDALPSVLIVDADGALSYHVDREVHEALAPYVLAWNCVTRNHETGELTPVPPPAEAGQAAFRAVDVMVGMWLGFVLKLVHRGGPDRPKESTPAEPTPDSPDAPS